MGDVSQRLNRSEFACKCKCGFATVHYNTPKVLEDLADRIQVEELARRVMILIDSGCRCREYNEIVQKRNNPNYVPYSSKSRHMWGDAIDFKILIITHGSITYQYDPEKVADRLEVMFPNSCGIGRYRTFTHFDNSLDKRRWRE